MINVWAVERCLHDPALKNGKHGRIQWSHRHFDTGFIFVHQGNSTSFGTRWFSSVIYRQNSNNFTLTLYLSVLYGIDVWWIMKLSDFQGKFYVLSLHVRMMALQSIQMLHLICESTFVRLQNGMTRVEMFLLIVMGQFCGQLTGKFGKNLGKLCK